MAVRGRSNKGVVSWQLEWGSQGVVRVRGQVGAVKSGTVKRWGVTGPPTAP